MAASTQISLNEYLETSYRPDREYVDGELKERNVGETDHARFQALLAAWFVAYESEWDVLVTTGQRVRVAADRVRIPDVTLVRPWALNEDVLTFPPLCVIEILSPEGTYSRTLEKAQDYRKMGVVNIWLIDPKTRSGQMSTTQGWRETMELEVTGSAVKLSLVDIFKRLDQSRKAQRSVE